METIPAVVVDTPEIGMFKIAITDIGKPLWFGNYQTGKLTVYQANIIEGVPKQPCIPLVYVVSNQDIPELNLWGYEVYSTDSSLGGMIESLLKVIQNYYLELAVSVRNEQQHTVH